MTGKDLPEEQREQREDHVRGEMLELEAPGPGSERGGEEVQEESLAHDQVADGHGEAGYSEEERGDVLFSQQEKPQVVQAHDQQRPGNQRGRHDVPLPLGEYGRRFPQDRAVPGADGRRREVGHLHDDLQRLPARAEPRNSDPVGRYAELGQIGDAAYLGDFLAVHEDPDRAVGVGYPERPLMALRRNPQP